MAQKKKNKKTNKTNNKISKKNFKNNNKINNKLSESSNTVSFDSKLNQNLNIDLFGDKNQRLNTNNKNDSEIYNKNETQIVKNGSNQVICDNNLSNDLIKISLNESIQAPKGLNNLGNTCYMNSVLQIISQTNILCQLLNDRSHDGYVWRAKSLRNINEWSFETQFDQELDVILPNSLYFTQTLTDFIRQMHGNNNKTINPQKVLNQIRKEWPQFGGWAQQDSHELLRCLLDSLKCKEIIRQRRGIIKELKGETDDSNVDDDTKARIKSFATYSCSTIIDSVFGGHLLSSISCDVCHYTNQIFEPFFDLSLPITSTQSNCNSTDIKIKDKDKDLKCVEEKYLINEDSKKLNPKERKMKRQQKKAEKREAKQQRKIDISNGFEDKIVGNNSSKSRFIGNFDNNIDEENWDEECAKNDDNSGNNEQSNQVLVENEIKIEIHSDIELGEVRSDEIEVKADENEIKSDECEVKSDESEVKSDESEVKSDESEVKSDESEVKSDAIEGKTGETEVQESEWIPEWNLNQIKTEENINSWSAGWDQSSDKSKDNSVDNSNNTNTGWNQWNNAVNDDDWDHNWYENEIKLDDSYEIPVEIWDFDNKDNDKTLDLNEKNSNNTVNESDNWSIEPLFGDITRTECLTKISYINTDGEVEEGEVFDCSLLFNDELNSSETQLDYNLYKPEFGAESGPEFDTESDDIKEQIQDFSLMTELDNELLKMSISDKEKISLIRSDLNSEHMRSIIESTMEPISKVNDLPNFSLISLLTNFTSVESLNGNNKYLCEQCTKNNSGNKTLTNASKRTLIAIPPPILTLNLKRFEAEGYRSRGLKKINSFVSFPARFDFSPFVSNLFNFMTPLTGLRKTDAIIYSLYGVVEHSGTIRSGHYTAYVKVRPINPNVNKFLILEQFIPKVEHILKMIENNVSNISDFTQNNTNDNCLNGDSVNGCVNPSNDGSDDDQSNDCGKWYHISDSSVSTASLATVLRSQAYILFYERIV